MDIEAVPRDLEKLSLEKPTCAPPGRVVVLRGIFQTASTLPTPTRAILITLHN